MSFKKSVKTNKKGYIAVHILIMFMGLITILAAVATVVHYRYVSQVRAKEENAKKILEENTTTRPEVRGATASFVEAKNIYIQSTEEFNEVFGFNFTGKGSSIDTRLTAEALKKKKVLDARTQRVEHISSLTGDRFTFVVGEDARRAGRKYILEFVNGSEYNEIMNIIRAAGLDDLNGIVLLHSN